MQEKLEIPVEAAMLCNMGTRKRAWKLRETVTSENTNPGKITKYACVVDAHESTRKRMEFLFRDIMRITSQREGDNSLTHYNLVHKFIPMPQVMKIPDAKAALDKEWEKLEKSPAWNLDKMKSKKDVILEAQKEKRKVHFATPMDICHLKNAELESKHKKYKGRVVLRGDTVKDDSGAYAVCTEQGSSASQMTAAKVMDVIARLSGCAGQAADAVSAHTPGKNGGRSKVAQNSKG